MARRGMRLVAVTSLSLVLAGAGGFARPALYLEGGGPGLLLSLNYEHRIAEALALRIGFGFALLGYTLPIALNMLCFSAPHHLELGVGVAPGEFALPLPGYPPTPVVLLVAHVGYRFSPPGGGFLFRIGFTPLFLPRTGQILPWGAIALGYAFAP